MNKKVCFITVLDRVVKHFMYVHINSYIEEGYEVTCISDMQDQSAYEKINGQIKKIEINISRTVNPINLLKNVFFLTKLFRKNKFDVIQYTGPSTSLICSIAGFLAKIKIRLYCLWGFRFEGFSGLKRIFFKFLEKITCKLSTSILLDSEKNRQYGISKRVFTNCKSRVIGFGSACGIDLSMYDYSQKEKYCKFVREKYGISKNTFVFGYVGRLTKDKGINELILATKKLIEDKYKFVFLFVGYVENDKSLCLELMNWAKGHNNIIFTGRSDNPEKFYATFDAFVFPSHREGYGGGCIQAGAFAVPSIVSNIRPLVDAICDGECGMIFDKGNVDQLSEKMEQIYNNAELRKNIGEKIRNRVEKYFEESVWKEDFKKYLREITEKNV